MTTQRELILVVCGAPLAARSGDVVNGLLGSGWGLSVVATQPAMAWIDDITVGALTGSPVRVDHRSPDQPKRGPSPAAVVVCPGTFNTVNKAAIGIADNYALGVICEALGSRVPLVVVPMVNDKLWGHPAWQVSLTTLEAAGTRFVDIHTGRAGARPVNSGSGGEAVSAFNPSWLLGHLEELAPRP